MLFDLSFLRFMRKRPIIAEINAHSKKEPSCPDHKDDIL
jgi:hypothetical protein